MHGRPQDSYSACVADVRTCAEPFPVAFRRDRHEGSGGHARASVARPLFTPHVDADVNEVQLHARGAPNRRGSLL
eukprot:7117673-Alexandrium_andersonii.AAC.1